MGVEISHMETKSEINIVQERIKALNNLKLFKK